MSSRKYAVVAPPTARNNVRTDLRFSPITHFRKGLAVRSFGLLILILLDSIALMLAWSIGIHYGTPIDSPWVEELSTFRLLSLAFEISIIAALGLYSSSIYRLDFIKIIKAVSLASVLLMLVAFLYDPEQYVSRSIFLVSWALSIFFICLFRFGYDRFSRYVCQKTSIRYSTFLICAEDERDNIIRLIEQESSYNLVGIADATSLDRSNRNETFLRLKSLGIQEVFVSWSAIRTRLHICWHFQTFGITLRLLPTELAPVLSILSRAEVSCVGGVLSPMIQVPVIVGGDYWIKRHLDKFFALLLLFILSPFLILIAILIKLDSPGPIFFKQTRIGLHGLRFKVWKFRTMVVNATQLQAILEARNEMKDGVLFKVKDDPRVTRVGKVLRRYSLDELPQLFNVITGEMSLIGPRPLPVRDVERFREKHFIRQEVLPGITGLWQVSGRSDIDDFEIAFNLDLTYIINWSLKLDMMILLKTVKVVFQRSGAY
ncbi:exopolysaccharide biosynthesis polyprenyl glycosylphosphotransferase subfamily [Synechococcus sp. PCC 7335]|uniref:sugar transferase n=1 Tax=Synechococcus sp. (strain ATCC 29403 / PCC 7335) TaxID=91464 RepID=UPI00017EC3F0|nr:sugar transferase [Synechococcus sp. PCC 7335]EDX84922.1 exopolysaccharide biosynthesis polyprenyl glycosylphosphotransferase subfamily [Synechococcus sp. PCC 7335]